MDLRGIESSTIEVQGESEQKLPEEMKYIVQDKNSFWEQAGEEEREETEEGRVQIKGVSRNRTWALLHPHAYTFMLCFTVTDSKTPPLPKETQFFSQ